MKKIDVVLALIAGEAVALLFVWFLKNSDFKADFLYWLLPLILPFMALMGLYICYLIGKKFLFVFQLGKFALVGACFAIFDLIILNLLMVYFGISEGISYDIFVTVSFIVATVVKYIFDKFWAFEKSDKTQVGTEFTKFFVITLVSWGIQLGAAHVVVNVIGPQFGMNKLIWGSVGKIAGIAVAFVWNFLGYKFVVFKK